MDDGTSQNFKSFALSSLGFRTVPTALCYWYDVKVGTRVHLQVFILNELFKDYTHVPFSPCFSVESNLRCCCWVMRKEESTSCGSSNHPKVFLRAHARKKTSHRESFSRCAPPLFLNYATHISQKPRRASDCCVCGRDRTWASTATWSPTITSPTSTRSQSIE